MKILILYHSGQTYTQTVFEHIASFRKFSEHSWFYLHYTELINEIHNLDTFQAIFLHYSVRLPYDQIDESMANILINFNGIKGLFIQDEYDYTNRAKYWIKKVGFNLIFTVVPRNSIPLIYPKEEYPGKIFISNLTGYAPDSSDLNLGGINNIQPSKRNITIGYRGRPLPIRYGKLGRDKIQIGKDVKEFCQKFNIAHDIAWDEESRIYGKKWYKFLKCCKAMLGSESGCNVFDWDGNLTHSIDKFKALNPKLNEDEIYSQLIKPLESDGLMNQISPRIFEMIDNGTIMILYEGAYSNIIKPNVHYLPLQRDLQNLPEIISRLSDDDFVDEMSSRAKKEIIESRAYSYSAFIQQVDKEINNFSHKNLYITTTKKSPVKTRITKFPKQAKPPPLSGSKLLPAKILSKFIYKIYNFLPTGAKKIIKKILGRA